MIRIKVCGITNERDALRAVKLGVDALGFIFAESPRKVSPEVVEKIVSLLPPFIGRVGIFVNEDKEKVRKIAQACFLTSLQFHGEEPPFYCQEFKWKVIKSFRVKDRGILREISRYKVDAYLLDTYCIDKRGGTGRTFDWEVAKEIRKLGVPVILSGGLNPENVVQAIIKVRPYAVDVSSGVEREKGKKDYQKLRDFVRKIRRQDELLSTT
ncbi:phosphoribosylanthranilate isomerase [Patescibacteria group bacterium]|nr:phosphoribosylanthranilate isomerase [Patescibacteria group bacterium]